MKGNCSIAANDYKRFVAVDCGVFAGGCGGLGGLDYGCAAVGFIAAIWLAVMVGSVDYLPPDAAGLRIRR